MVGKTSVRSKTGRRFFAWEPSRVGGRPCSVAPPSCLWRTPDMVRIATLGEEVRDPARIIPRAVISTLAVSALLYTAVAWTGWSIARGSGNLVASFSEAEAEAAPLAGLIGGVPAQIVEIGAIVAMLGVLLNLVLGLSRVWLAMGRRRDMPAGLAPKADIDIDAWRLRATR